MHRLIRYGIGRRDQRERNLNSFGCNQISSGTMGKWAPCNTSQNSLWTEMVHMLTKHSDPWGPPQRFWFHGSSVGVGDKLVFTITSEDSATGYSLTTSRENLALGGPWTDLVAIPWTTEMERQFSFVCSYCWRENLCLPSDSQRGCSICGR